MLAGGIIDYDSNCLVKPIANYKQRVFMFVGQYEILDFLLVEKLTFNLVM